MLRPGGMAWGLLVWILAQTVVAPLLGGGFFSARVGGFLVAVGSLIGLLIYGFVFGVVASRASQGDSLEGREFEQIMQGLPSAPRRQMSWFRCS